MELFVDACDYGWGATLAQRISENGPRRLVCCFSKSFSRTEQAWSTFERELCGLKDAMRAVEHLSKGFPLIVYTDHKNNLFTDTLVGGKRIQKKLVRWSLEVDEMTSKVTRVWLKGEDNILGDAPSRNPKGRDAARDAAPPCGPVHRIVEWMFAKPDTEEEQHERTRFLGEIDQGEPDPRETAGDRPEQKPVGRSLPDIIAEKTKVVEEKEETNPTPFSPAVECNQVSGNSLPE